ncbi:hypothetical protein VitviT2T_023841 [Vitis vinifera]|uniref:WRC domain-containing protein n=2 Tax=Vitis vinifera TaxID=29760 RepID=D7UCH0_VITVI|eukprot:XP_002278446.1 PREDICTED: uncharacterized protein LOC100241428 [Vitis vinifera]
MRIRGNARIADIMDLDGIAPAYPPEMLQTHVCQLNQSPWDVVTFPADSTFTFPPENRFDGDDSFTANGSIGDSIGAVESRSLVPVVEDDDATNPNDRNPLSPDTRVVEEDKPAAKTKPDEIASTKNKTILFCNKSDGKGWQCRKAAKEGHALCEHHLAQLRSYNSSNQSSSRKLDKPADRPSVRRRGRGLKKPPSNPNEYYYYSGFGPLWGKKRGGSKPESNRNELKTESPPSYSSQIDSPDDPDQKIEEEHHHDDDDEDDDDMVDEEENGESAKKRNRKPVKARSLKSLM